MASPDTEADPRVTVYAITGMVCGNCETFVTEALTEVPGILTVEADAASGRVTVTTRGEPDDVAVGEAVDEIGYDFTGRV